MRYRDVMLEVRDINRNLQGQIDFGYLMSAQIIKRFNTTGAWKISLPNEYRLVSALKQPGAGLVCTLRDKVFLSGPMINWTLTASQDDPTGTVEFVGVDDMVALADQLAYPTPTTDSMTGQTSANDVRTGKAEDVLKGFVNANIGPSGPAARRKAGLTLAASTSRGANVTGSARFDQLGLLLAQTAAQGGGLGFDVVQSGNGLVFDVYTPSDKSSTVRMDIYNDLLESTQSGIGAPGLTRAVVAGQGVGSARKFIEVSDALSLAAESAWGRRIELFIDQRNTNDDTELTQAGQEQINDKGRSTTSLKVTPTDGDTMLFNQDWFVGDTVGVGVDSQLLLDQVSEAILVVDAGSARIGATIGDPVGYDWEASITDIVQTHDARLAQLEKSL